MTIAAAPGVGGVIDPVKKRLCHRKVWEARSAALSSISGEPILAPSTAQRHPIVRQVTAGDARVDGRGLVLRT
jgi:hypothetical protein